MCVMHMIPDLLQGRYRDDCGLEKEKVTVVSADVERCSVICPKLPVGVNSHLHGGACLEIQPFIKLSHLKGS